MYLDRSTYKNDNNYVIYHSVGNATISAANLVDSLVASLPVFAVRLAFALPSRVQSQQELCHCAQVDLTFVQCNFGHFSLAELHEIICIIYVHFVSYEYLVTFDICQ